MTQNVSAYKRRTPVRSPLLTMDDLMRRYKVHRNTIMRWVADEKMQFPKPNPRAPGRQRLYWDRKRIEAFDRYGPIWSAVVGDNP